MIDGQMGVEECIVRSVAHAALAGKGCPPSYGDRVIDALHEAGYAIVPAEKPPTRGESESGPRG